MKILAVDISATRDTGTADQVAQMLADLDPRAAKADVEGLLLPIGDRAYFKFAKLLHMREAPELGDITREFTKRRLGRLKRLDAARSGKVLEARETLSAATMGGEKDETKCAQSPL